MEISIIIINYNCYEFTYNCIMSIIKNTSGIEYEIIVIDNNSTDDSMNKIMSSFSDCCTFIKNDKNYGFGKANNKAVMYSKGEYILFLNSDTEILNNAIKEAKEYYKKINQNIGCLGCYLRKGNGSNAISYSDFPTKKRILFYSVYSTIISIFPLLKYINYARTLKKVTNYKEHDSKRVDYVSGAFLLILKSLFFDIGGFDPDYFMYFEECQLQKKLYEKGFHNYIVSGPQVIHFEGGAQLEVGNLKSVFPFREYLYDSSMLKYVKKNFSESFCILIRCFMLLKYNLSLFKCLYNSRIRQNASLSQ